MRFYVFYDGEGYYSESEQEFGAVEYMSLYTSQEEIKETIKDFTLDMCELDNYEIHEVELNVVQKLKPCLKFEVKE